MAAVPVDVQEKGALWIMKRVLNENKEYSSASQIKEDPKYNELKKIFNRNLDNTGNVPQDWIESYYKQQKEMLKKFGSKSFTEFKYKKTSGSFHDYITSIYKQYKVGRYENWNAADIWIVNGNQNQIETQINKAIGGSIATQNVDRLNSVLRYLFKQKKVIGISLKKVSGKVAHFVEVNVDKKDVFELDKINYKFKVVGKPKLDLTMNVNKKLGKYETQDLVVIVESSNEKIRFQIKGNTTSSFSNLKFETTQIGSSAARAGKAEVQKVSDLLRAYTSKKFKNNYNNHPKNVQEFNDPLKLKKYVKMFNDISRSVETNITSGENEFIQMFNLGFQYDPITANAKLLEMEFIHTVLEIQSRKIEDFWTDMVWLSQKRGKGFGPHGKLY